MEKKNQYLRFSPSHLNQQLIVDHHPPVYTLQKEKYLT